MDIHIDSVFHSFLEYLSLGGLVLAEALDHLDDTLSEWPPVLLVALTAFFVTVAMEMYRWYSDSDLTLMQRGKRKFFKMLRSAPIIGSKIKKELKSTKTNIAQSSFKLPKGENYRTTLPKTGLSHQELMSVVKKNYKNLEEIDWQKGKVSGTVYTGENHGIMGQVFELFCNSNLLQPGVFPGVRKMEAEIVAMCCDIFKGGPESCGTTTSGGTESLLLACLAYRELARARGVQRPEILLPICGHAAFEKAAHLFEMRIVRTPLNKTTYKADVQAMKKMINKNTCMLVVSAPCFPHGIIDPISEVAKLGLKYNIPVHIDMCMGGFLYPFLRLGGHDIPPSDFSVAGITSISADLHKYGKAPKGSSVVLYSDQKYRQGQFFVSTDWVGGVYASPTLAGTRSGAVIATAWATLMLQGLDGYIQHADRVIKTRESIEKRLREIEGITVIGQPKVSAVTIASNVFDVFRLGTCLTEKGWQMYTVQNPSGLCVTVTDLFNKETANQLIADVEEGTAQIMKDPNAKAEGMAAIYGMASTLPDRSLVSDFICGYLDAFYSTESHQ
ncbi:sphingosine-1-phosphate lyase 1 isoform X1 [Strongylocentrotus purpuratus]|uniref:sphinganine-1-phosphate aldolase n=1 Tax=Strongylocentrotus purpuratus TaxID=7668 RepID=A0A7M7NDP6_STRPU|nr:sphingosine-1-phosphate lyase 1 isoform X1 [Strongylocentrotus purpuratus]